jgi:hypothetical protein
MMTTLDHAVEEEYSRSQFPSEEEEYSRNLFPSEEEEKEYSRTHFPCRRRRDTFHVFMSAVKMAFHIVFSGKSHFILWTC